MPLRDDRGIGPCEIRESRDEGVSPDPGNMLRASDTMLYSRIDVAR